MTTKAEEWRTWAEAFASMPPENRTFVVDAFLADLDGKAVGGFITAAAQAIATVLKENPDLAGKLEPVTTQTVEAIDFGKVRVAASEVAKMKTGLAKNTIDAAFSNPVVLANAYGVLPPVVNALIGILAHAVSRIDLPPEMLASSLFNMIDDIDGKELGRLINLTSEFTCKLHKGNKTLGGDEPRFRSVMQRFAEETLEEMDPETVFNAGVALAEDLGVVLTVSNDLLRRDPELIRGLFQIKLAMGQTLVSAMTGVLQSISELSDADLGEMGGQAQSQMDTRELARIFNTVFAISGRIARENPGLYGRMVTDFVSELDGEVASKTFGNLAKEIATGAASDPSLKKTLAPEEVGQKINGMLVAFNTRVEKGPLGASQYMQRVLSQVDAHQLEKAWKHVTDGATGALVASGERAMALVRPMISAGWKLVKLYAGSLKKKVLG